MSRAGTITRHQRADHATILTMPHVEPWSLKACGLDHIALRCTDLARSRRFYVEVLALPVVVERPNLFIVRAGDSLVGVVGPDSRTPAGDIFSPIRVGLDHVALRVRAEAELHAAAAALSERGVEHTGVRINQVRGNAYVAFKDPDGIAWQLCL